ncbi:hypothetical protein A2641_02335 [Candidatus Nomurabacteria bacterium RIFCSPHIGHO2_01_FULL_37_25]|uniref:Uncharacterized protein n=1 Tax=Candidatus Nomurabacteria bacterium RIFCSPLOWO2_01_FULL_36_16 TaxID=1801767 RepID=A0A1F6WYF8_9BACT|nr:MAG: hypothetical protein A2641_02335 [Candidatus Nomurabacteria bacterium RIFCSPHIGHO2_01_FULL_37_25]OGI75825.1 MAG: hypothetical protein A3D36_00495 [Candidatus Nomurabacteria bacterium RIFCSPHIGHO2_02_FULL_36_29]OGI86765.1 MAG: hypothetical protein A3A91_02050 [Candidatus Nomurabacteria bacterium RIFCSPLOWO2_01_FULL_36_16]
MNNTESNYHYYGDSVRTLFIIGGLIMVVSYPFFSSFISLPIPLSIVGAVGLAIFGGLMNPKQKLIMVLNTIVSIGAFVVFEYYAVYAYLHLPPSESLHVAFFWVNQALSLIFFFAIYLSTKTLRGAIINQ